jgi:hypothetical protein
LYFLKGVSSNEKSIFANNCSKAYAAKLHRVDIACVFLPQSKSEIAQSPSPQKDLRGIRGG